MTRLIKKRFKKAGLPPGSLVHIGEDRPGGMKATLIAYDESSITEKDVTSRETCDPFKDKAGVSWIDVDGVSDVAAIESLCGCYGLHPLVMEDILNTDQRPKMEDYGDYIYIVLRMLRLDGMGDDWEVLSEQVSLVLGKNFLISFQEQGKEGDVFDTVRTRIRADKGRIRKMGPDYLAYSLMDAIIDNYFVVLERLGERVEEVEERLVTDPGRDTLVLIQGLKREMLYLRKSVWPLREVVAAMERGESPLINPGTGIYLRDVYDHTIQVVDTIEIYREMLSGMVDIYLSSLSNRMNEVMKVLTVIATIFIPMTFVAGVYGMNFKYMPELEWHYGYAMFWIIILAIGVVMLVYFKKKKWT